MMDRSYTVVTNPLPNYVAEECQASVTLLKYDDRQSIPNLTPRAARDCFVLNFTEGSMSCYSGILMFYDGSTKEHFRSTVANC